jgi:mxaJ protein
MSSVFRNSAAFLLLLSSAAVAHAEPLRVCAESDNLPFSDRSGAGFELEVARLLALDLGRPLEVVYVSQRTPDFLRTTIGAGACDMIMSVPTRFGRLATTGAWYRSAYVAVAPPGKLQAHAAAADMRELIVGVVGGNTPAALVLASQKPAGARTYSVFEARHAIEDVAAGRLDAALVWGPAAGWQAARFDGKLALSSIDPEGAQPLAFDISIGVRKADEALRQELDRTITGRRADIAAILASWHVPRAD